MQYSEQAEAERASVLEQFRQSTIGWNQNAISHPDEGVEPENQKSCMIIVTDACLPFVALGEAPLAARVLINYELPSKKVNLYLSILSFFYDNCFFFFATPVESTLSSCIINH